MYIFTWYLVCWEGVLLVLCGRSDEEKGEVGGGEEVGVGKGEGEGLSCSEWPVQLPPGSSYEQTISEHSPNHLQLLLSPKMLKAIKLPLITVRYHASKKYTIPIGQLFYPH